MLSLFPGEPVFSLHGVLRSERTRTNIVSVCSASWSVSLNVFTPRVRMSDLLLRSLRSRLISSHLSGQCIWRDTGPLCLVEARCIRTSCDVGCLEYDSYLNSVYFVR
jgi:hypothetical protein